MKYMIHGATNGSNFGDCLFAHLFYRYISQEMGEKATFFQAPVYGLGSFLKKELNYTDDIKCIKSSDALVYMSGGYFGDTVGGLKESLIRYVRYFGIGVWFANHKKYIYICGIGGGPVHNDWLRRKIIKLMNTATSISVRDEETAEYFQKNGVVSKIITTTDTALCLRDMEIPMLESAVFTLISSIAKGRKLLFVHVYGEDKYNTEIEEKIIPAVNRFVDTHSEEYVCIVGKDNMSKTHVEDLSVYHKIRGDKIPYDFYDTMQMCALLNMIDCAITVKLHVGIVSAVYGKSVISIAKHKNKTKRFYRQIGEIDRCKQITDVDAQNVYDLLEKYHDKKIQISNQLFDLSKKNLEIIGKRGINYE